MSALVFSFDAFRAAARPNVGRQGTNPVAMLSFEERRARNILSVQHSPGRCWNIADNFYPTPPEATRALLSVESFDGPIWEPACGEGHIARVLMAAGLDVVATDLNDRGFGTVGVDFLRQRAMRGKHIVPEARLRHIVTNPPYGAGLADAFIETSLAFTAETGGKVAMLLNLNSLCHHSRTTWWRTHPPARIYAIDSVVCWSEPDRAPPRHFAANRYYWAVWTPDHVGPSAFWWLSAAEFREPVVTNFQSSRSNPRSFPCQTIKPILPSLPSPSPSKPLSFAWLKQVPS